MNNTDIIIDDDFLNQTFGSVKCKDTRHFIATCLPENNNVFSQFCFFLFLTEIHARVFFSFPIHTEWYYKSSVLLKCKISLLHLNKDDKPVYVNCNWFLENLSTKSGTINSRTEGRHESALIQPKQEAHQAKILNGISAIFPPSGGRSSPPLSGSLFTVTKKSLNSSSVNNAAANCPADNCDNSADEPASRSLTPYSDREGGNDVDRDAKSPGSPGSPTSGENHLSNISNFIQFHSYKNSRLTNNCNVVCQIKNIFLNF